MKSKLYVLAMLLLLGLPWTGSAQGIFVSSDALMVMNIPMGWDVIETAPQTVTATADNAQVTITYGQALGLPPFNGDQEVTLSRRLTEGLPALVEQRAVLSSEVIRNETIYRLHPVLASGDTPSEGNDATYIVDSVHTGPTQFEVTGSIEPIVEMLAIYYAYNPPPPISYDCESITLAQNHGAPGELIQMTGLPNGVEGFEMRAIIPGFEEPPGLMAYANLDEAFFLSPIYPDLRLIGGSATIQLIDNGTVCQEIAFTIDPLPEAPGEFARYVDAAQQYIDATVAWLNIPPGAIMGTDVPEELIPLAAAQYWVNHPDNPNTLVSILETATDEELKILDALIASDGFVDILTYRTEVISAQPSLPTLDAANEETIVVSNSMFPPQQAPSPLTVAGRVEINTPEQLSYYMRLQAHYQDATEAIAGATGFAGDTSTIAGTGVAAAENSGMMTAGAASAAGRVSGYAGVALFAGSTTLGIYQNLLPSDFVKMEVFFDEWRFSDEDSTETHQVESAYVTVRSQRFPVTKTIADAAATLIGTKTTASGIKGVNANPAAKAKGEFTDYTTTGNALTAYDVGGYVCGAKCANDDTVTIGPYYWNNIKFDFTINNGQRDDAKFLRFGIATQLTGDEPSIQIFDRVYFRAIDDGMTVVGIQLEPSAFGGQTITRRAHLFVDPIAVFTNVPPYAKPGQQVCATAPRVNHAEDETLEWELRRVGSEIPLQETTTPGDAPHQFCFTMPTPAESDISRTRSYEDCRERERAAFVIIAEATTKDGARAFNYDEPRRAVQAVYMLNEQDICAGLWETLALREDEEFCDFSPPVPTDMGAMTSLDSILRFLSPTLGTPTIDSAVAGQVTISDIEVLDEGDSLRITDMESGRQNLFPRLDERSTVEDIGVKILLQEEAERIGGTENTRTERWEVVGDGELVLIRAPEGSTVWLDGQRYRKEFNIPSTGQTRQVEPFRVNILFVSPDTFISVVSWRFVGNFALEGVTYEADCDIDFVSIGQVIEGLPEAPDDDEAPEEEEPGPTRTPVPLPEEDDDDDK